MFHAESNLDLLRFEILKSMGLDIVLLISGIMNVSSIVMNQHPC